MNGLAACAKVLRDHSQEVQLDAALIEEARAPIQRMLDFSEAYKNYHQQHQQLGAGLAQFQQWLATQHEAKYSTL